jgi:RecA-family ATPase
MQNTDIIDAILPSHEVSILAGASGAGKTTLIMQVLCALQANVPVWGHAAQPNLRLGYIAADRSWRSYQKTAALSNLDLEPVHVRTLVDDPTVNLRDFERSPIDELERLISTMLPVDLIVVDPLVVFLGVDTNKYHLNAARLIRLNKLCLANKITLLGTHHATKARSDYSFKRAQDRISGTSALLGFTSTQLFLASPQETGREDNCYEWHIISHHAPSKILLLTRENGKFEYVGEESTAPQPLEDRLLGLFFQQDAPLTRQDIQAALRPYASRATIDRLLANSVSSKILARDGYGSYCIPHNPVA